MHDSLASGRTFLTFNVIVDFNRWALAIEIDTSMPAVRVGRVLDALPVWRGYSRRLGSDNGPEFSSNKLDEWPGKNSILLDFIELGMPVQNANIEWFNRTYWKVVLDLYLFDNLAKAREITEAWLEECNAIRPHDSLGDLPPYRHAAEAGS